jgi:hypothetical protein
MQLFLVWKPKHSLGSGKQSFFSPCFSQIVQTDIKEKFAKESEKKKKTLTEKKN